MRPALTYMGSKWRIASWVCSFFPRHTFYVEPFGGSAAVLLEKKPSPREVYNDLNGDVANFFRVLRDEDDAAELIRRLRLTPYSRAEYDSAWRKKESDGIERARALAVRSWFSFGARGATATRPPGFNRGRRSLRSDVAGQFSSWVDSLDAIAKRMRGVVVDCADALDVMQFWDSPDTLHYCDPPYNCDYAGDYVVDVGQETLLDKLKVLEGFVVLSGYDNELYRAQLAGWHVEACNAIAFMSKRAVECLWLSPRTWEALKKERNRVPMSLLCLS